MNFTIPKKILACAHFRARSGARASVFHVKSKNVLFLMFMQNILHWRAPDRARKCARAKHFFRIVKFMKFPTFYVFWIFSYLLNWFLWMALKCVVFSRKIRFFMENFQKFLKFWKFSKKSNFQKKISNSKLL